MRITVTCTNSECGHYGRAKQVQLPRVGPGVEMLGQFYCSICQASYEMAVGVPVEFVGGPGAPEPDSPQARAQMRNPGRPQ
jgi:hypothetical protein